MFQLLYLSNEGLLIKIIKLDESNRCFIGAILLRNSLATMAITLSPEPILCSGNEFVLYSTT